MQKPSLSNRQWMLLLAAAALFLRLLFLARFTASPLFVPVSGGNDCWLYLSIAERCAAGQWMPAGVFEYMPLYAWLLGLLALAAGGKTLLAAALLGALLDAATVGLIFQLARRCDAPRWAAIAGALLFACYPLAITYSALNMPNTLNAFLVLAYTTLLHGLVRQTPLWKWLLAGALAGVACLSFAGMLLIAVVTAIRCIAAAPSAAGKVAALLSAAALPILPVSLHNFRAEGHFVLITAHGGFNFYLGNHDGATGYPMLLKGFRGERGNLLADARDEAARLEGKRLTSAEFARHWNERAKRFLREQPGKAARLMALKFVKFWNRAEYDDLRMLPMLRLTDTAFTRPVWPGFGVISVFGFAGLLAARRSGLVRLVAATAMLSIVLFFITSRYRLTVAPLLCVLGAAGLRPLDLWLRERGPLSGAMWRWLGAWAAGCALALWPLRGTDFRALDHYNTATHLMEKAKQTGDGALVEQALAHSNQGLTINPRSPDLHFLAGNAYFGLARTNEAVAAYRAAIALNPRQAQAYFNLAVIAAQGGHRAAAVSNATRALELDPGLEMARTFLHDISRLDTTAGDE